MDMEQVGQQQREAMAELLQILAEFYKYPDQLFYSDVTAGKISTRLVQLGELAEMEVLIPQELQSELPSFHQYKQEYIRAMLPGHNKAAIPVESVYKAWTEDKSAKLNIAAQKGYLMGDAAIHMKHLLEGLGLEIPDSYSNMPDHLTIILELTAHLLLTGTEDQVKMFIDDHLDWLQEYKEKLVEIEALAIFEKITHVLLLVVNQLRAKYSH